MLFTDVNSSNGYIQVLRLKKAHLFLRLFLLFGISFRIILNISTPNPREISLRGNSVGGKRYIYLKIYLVLEVLFEVMKYYQNNSFI